LVVESKKGLAAARELQDSYDAVGWQIQEPTHAKVRHILLHLMKVTADVAALVEHVEHEIHNGVDPEQVESSFRKVITERSDIAGELLFHAAQFANLGDYDLAEPLIAIYSRNAQRFAPESEFVGLSS
jgi:hypothetical protein